MEVLLGSVEELDSLRKQFPSKIGIRRSETECILDHVFIEIGRARNTHPSMGTVLDAYTIIREEMEEFFDSVKINSPDINELYQVIACCLMAVEDVFGISQAKFYLHRDHTGKLSDYPTIYQIYASGQLYFDRFWDDVKSGQPSCNIPHNLLEMACIIFTGLVFLLRSIREEEERREFGDPWMKEWESKFYRENF